MTLFEIKLCALLEGNTFVRYRELLDARTRLLPGLVGEQLEVFLAYLLFKRLIYPST